MYAKAETEEEKSRFMPIITYIAQLPYLEGILPPVFYTNFFISNDFCFLKAQNYGDNYFLQFLKKVLTII